MAGTALTKCQFSGKSTSFHKIFLGMMKSDLSSISECMTRNIAPVEQVYYCFIGMKALNYIDKWDGIPRGWGKF